MVKRKHHSRGNCSMQRFCLSLTLRHDPELMAEYIRLHQDVWPEIRESIYDAHVIDMQIYRCNYQLFMIMDTTDDFTLEAKAALDAANPKVIEWEALMSRFQLVESGDNPTKKWVPLEKIFQLH